MPRTPAALTRTAILAIPRNSELPDHVVPGLSIWRAERARGWSLTYASPLTGKRRRLKLGSPDTGMDLEAARAAARTQLSLLARGIDPRDPKETTISGVIDRYERDRLTERRAGPEIARIIRKELGQRYDSLPITSDGFRAWHVAPVRLAILTGQRRGEIAALQDEWVDGAWIAMPADFYKTERPDRFYLTDLARAQLAARLVCYAREAGMERHLAAILAADLVGYSRLMGEDEAGTLLALSRLRKDLIKPLIAEHHGRVVKLTGDGILAEFSSVVDAVTCAVAWQSAVTKGDHERALQFRIGVNLGDVIVEDGDIYGNGVNVASRLEGLSEPGGVCVSGTVYGEVKNKLDLTFEDLGDQAVKNIAEPIHAYRIAIGKSAMPPKASTNPRLRLPNKRSIAVLPFTNMSGDPEQEYFSDGITEDIITDLSKISGLYVASRSSSFVYKGAQVKIEQVAVDLRVSFVLEGSVQKAGNDVRISAQLIDGSTGGHVWAERYDRELTNIFHVQDDITTNIVEALKVAVSGSDKRVTPHTLRHSFANRFEGRDR